MIKQRKDLRLVLTIALAAGVMVLPLVVHSPSVEAADCGGSSGGAGEEWLVTPNAAARTLRGDCPANAECREVCLVSCGEVEPQGDFQCFAL